MAKWICTSCSFESEGVNPPKKCPVCGAGKDAFELMEDRVISEKGEDFGESEDEEWEEELEVDDDSE